MNRPLRHLVASASLVCTASLTFVACTSPQTPAATVADTDASSAASPTTTTADSANGLDRKKVPEPGPAPTLRAPVPTRLVLDNGLTVLVIEKRDLPLVGLRVVVRSGSADDPASLPGLAGFVADMLKAGTKKRNAETLAASVESLGADLAMGAGDDSTTLTAAVMTQHFPALFEVVADVITNSTFAPAELDRTREKRLTALKQEVDNPARLATRTMREVVFGAHPYGHTALGTRASLTALRQRDLAAFFETHFRPDNIGIIVVGDIDTAGAQALVAQHLGSWKRRAVTTTPRAAATRLPRRIVLVDRPGAPQSQLVVTQLGLERTSPDYFASVLTNMVLGGQFNSRLNMKLREEKGYTYGASSNFEYARAPGAFFAQAAVRTDVTAEAAAEMLREIARLGKDGVTQAELDAARTGFTQALPGYFQTVHAIAQVVGNIFVFDLPLDYYRVLPDALARITVDDVQRLARERLDPDKLSIVVVGDRNHVAPALGDLGRGTVEVVSTSR